MKTEDKQLLIEDLCARLSYGVKISVNDKVETLQGINIPDNIVEYDSFLASDIEEVRPYLFPMSSMTEKQIDELKDLCDMYDPVNDNDYCEDWGTRLITKNIMNDGYRFNFNFKLFEFLNKNRLDYHGLIEKGLAINATNLNIY